MAAVSAPQTVGALHGEQNTWERTVPFNHEVYFSCSSVMLVLDTYQRAAGQTQATLRLLRQYFTDGCYLDEQQTADI